MPDVPMSDIVERALRRVIGSSSAERRKLLSAGARFVKDMESMESFDRVPYSIDHAVWVDFGETLEKRREHPGKVLVGAVMAEIGMS